MLAQRTIKRAVCASTRRTMGTAVLTEQFPGTPSVTPTAAGSSTISTTTLGNGIKVATRESSNGLGSVKIAVAAGSAAESSSEKGAAHILGMTAFAGTQDMSGLALIRELDNLGAIVGSSADRTSVCYDVSYPQENESDVLALMGAAVGSAPDAYVYSDAKQGAKGAYDSLQTSAHAMLSELIYEAAFGDDSAMGASMYAKSLAALSPEAVASFRAANYTAGNVAIAGSGVSITALTGLASAMNLPSGGGTAVTSAFQGGEVRFKANYGDNANVAVAFPTTGNVKTMEVLQTYLAGKLSGSGLTPFTSAGLMGFMASGPAAAVSAGMTTLMAEVKAVAGGASTADAIAAVGIARAIAAESSCGSPVMLESILTGEASTDMGSVTPDAVSKATAAALKTGPAYAILGSVPGTPSLKSLM